MTDITHAGLGGTVTADMLPVEYQRQDITAELTVPQIVEDLEAIVAWGLEAHALLTAAIDKSGRPKKSQERIKAMSAASTYSNITAETSRLIAKIATKTRLVTGAEPVPPEEADKLKLRYAKLQAGNMALLAHAIDFARQFGIADLDGSIHYWAERSMSSLMNSCVANYRNWAQLLLLEEKRGDAPDNRYEAIQKKLLAKR